MITATAPPKAVDANRELSVIAAANPLKYSSSVRTLKVCVSKFNVKFLYEPEK